MAWGYHRLWWVGVGAEPSKGCGLGHKRGRAGGRVQRAALRADARSAALGVRVARPLRVLEEDWGGLLSRTQQRSLQHAAA